MAEERKGEALSAGVLGAAVGAAAGTGVGYALGKARPAEAEEPKEVLIVYQLDEETRLSIAQSIATVLEPTVKELARAPKEQKQSVFKHTVGPLAGVIEHKHIPMLKTVKTVTIHWPPGCSALVDVAAGYSQDKRLLPVEGYLALDNTTSTWVVNKETDSDTLWVEIRNGDSANPHTISIAVNYEEAS